MFKSRLDSTESRLNDDFDQLSSSSQFSTLLEALLKIFSALKKKFHRRSISLQSISLNYAIILENRHTVKYSQSIQQLQREKTSISARTQLSQKQEITTSSNESSIITKSSQRKNKARDIREETTNEEILKMNRIIKTDLQEMFNVIVIADIAAVIAAISHAASQSFESTATSQIVKTRQKR